MTQNMTQNMTQSLTKTKNHLRINVSGSFSTRKFISRVARISLHSNQMWKDLREFYSLTGVFEKFLKIKN